MHRTSRKSPPPRRKTPTQERSRATVACLLDAAAQVLVAEGYSRMTTTRVAARAGVSVGSLYQYFATKEALVRALAERKMARTYEAVHEALSDSAGQPLEPRVRRMVANLFAVKAQHAELGAAIAHSMAEIEGHDYVARVTQAARGLLTDVFAAHRDEIDVPDLAVAAHLVAHAIEGIVGSLVVSPIRPLSDPVWAEETTRLVMGYLRRA